MRRLWKFVGKLSTKFLNKKIRKNCSIGAGRKRLVNESHNEMKDDFLRNYKTHLYISNTIAELV